MFAGAPQVVVRTVGTRRPVDKKLVVIAKATVDATQQNTTLVTATFPCTIVGLRWSIGTVCDAGTAGGNFGWVIAIVKDGNTTGNLALTDGGDLYTPEGNVMAFGATVNGRADGATVVHWHGNTKTMRKLMGGDVLVFSCQGVATNTSKVCGCIQFFCKT